MKFTLFMCAKNSKFKAYIIQIILSMYLGLYFLVIKYEKYIKLGAQEQGYDHPIKSKNLKMKMMLVVPTMRLKFRATNLRKNEHQNHSNKKPGLLGQSTNSGITNNSYSVACTKSTESTHHSSCQMAKACIQSIVGT